MIVITGAAGFIGSALLSWFNKYRPELTIIIVDNFSVSKKARNYQNKKWVTAVDRNAFFGFFEEIHHKIEFIFHLGARTDTTEKDVEIFDRLNLNYSKKMWKKCVEYNIPLIYASSAATYGDGSLDYKDDHEIINHLLPLNPYGKSKNDFDKWVLDQEEEPRFWAGLKFFNVYGPNEYHKGRMASVIFHAFEQIRLNKEMKLFRSHRDDFEDGQQLRDFIYVKDVLKVCQFLFEKKDDITSGIYNVGTGKARSFDDLVHAVFNAMGLEANISYTDIPEDIRDNYQYFTEADMNKLHKSGYSYPMCTLEEGIEDYIGNYLLNKEYL